MKKELLFHDILQYYKGELTGHEKTEVEKIIQNNWYYQEILNGLTKISQQTKMPPELVIEQAKKRFLNKLK